MDLKLVEALLDKYYNGETTLEEERSLRAFFSREEVPSHLKDEKIKFQFYCNALNESVDWAFEEKLVSGYTGTHKIMPFFNRIRTASIAAGILLLAGVSLCLNKDTLFKKKNNYGTYDNPQIAYNQTKKALLLISDKLNKGNRNLSKISRLNEMDIFLTKIKKQK